MTTEIVADLGAHWLARAAYQRLPLERLASMMLEAEGEHGVQLPQHTIVHAGMIHRTMEAPAGVLILGCQHKAAHMAVCIGDIDVYDGERIRHIRGHDVLDCQAGIRRIGYTRSPVVWITVHRCPDGINRGSTLEQIEDALLVDSERLQSRRTGALPEL
jgi:hypothetical protein